MSFEYAPFTGSRQIRLLKASFDHAQTDVIQCDFLVADLDALPCEFIAISYLWGPPEKPEKVWCNGLSIDITLSAMSVLRMAASDPDIEYIWIDALCIDQSNILEKSVQIRLMRYVYPAAKRTIAWLGNSTATSDDAMNFIVTLHAALKEIELRNADTVTLSPLVDIEGCHWPSPRWDALSILLDNQ
ncbi:hypothetical protein VTL71DRAFT_13403 [Oculimacula yallundae]|uniref:Heterokaryon incompatibility domain-containing protein n=1 Tax=Oculimacula yallundae TaxID=86028 RepID=A0ABR4CKV8_9HELO